MWSLPNLGERGADLDHPMVQFLVEGVKMQRMVLGWVFRHHAAVMVALFPHTLEHAPVVLGRHSGFHSDASYLPLPRGGIRAISNARSVLASAQTSAEAVCRMASPGHLLPSVVRTATLGKQTGLAMAKKHTGKKENNTPNATTTSEFH